MSPDVRLYLVTGDVGPDRSLPEVVRAAVAGGVTLVQLRDKSADAAALTQQVADLRGVLAATGVPLIVNDDVQVADAVRAEGVHLGPDDRRPDAARETLPDRAIVGWSIHDTAQLADAEAIAASDYLAASPVWPTATKPNTTAPFGLDGVRRLRREMPEGLPLVGIGGIDVSNCADVIAAGADGVAVVSAICAAPDPEAAARELRKSIDAALADRSNR